MRVVTPLLAVVASLALPASAGAATVSMTDGFAGSFPQYRALDFTLVADSGADDLVITGSETEFQNEWRVRDESAHLDASGLCQRVDDHEAVCPHDRFEPIFTHVTLNGGDDRLALQGRLGGRLDVTGGDGDDAVHGSPADVASPITFFGGAGDDTLAGGPSDERMTGDAGYDTFHGGDGKDVYDRSHDGSDGANLIDGGVGEDEVTYWDRNAEVDLQAGTDSLGDQLVSIEDVEFADTVYGSDDANTLQGSGIVVGRGGNDTLKGESFDNFFDGGPGDDYIEAFVGSDDVHCGPGNDLVNGVVFTTLVRPDCEVLDSGHWYGERVPRQPTGIGADSATFTIPCTPHEGGDRWCRVSALVRGIARPARRTVWSPNGLTASVTVPLPKDVLRVLAAGRVPTVYVFIDLRSRPMRNRGPLRQVYLLGYRTPFSPAA